MKWQPYPEYKYSNISWLGNIPSQWTMARADAKLSYCNENVSVEQMANQTLFHYSIPIVQETGNGQIEDGDTIDSGKNIITKPVVLISKLNPRKGTIVTAFPQKQLTVCSGEFIQLAPKGCCLKYVEYLFRSESIRQYLSSTVQSVTRSHQRTDPDIIRRIWWGWPSQDEQRAIAAFLDRETEHIDNLVAKKECQIELLQEKQVALISHVVTKGLDPNIMMKDSGVDWLGKIPEHWRVQKLKYNSYIKGRIGWQNLRSDEFTDSGPFLVTGMHFKNGSVDWSACFHITEDRYLIAPEIFVQEGDVLITKDGSIGKLAYIDHLPGKASLNSHLLILRPRNGVYDSLFMYYLLGSQMFRRFVLTEQSGTTFYGISQESIENFPALFPTLSEQKSIVAYLERETGLINRLVKQIRNSIKTFKEYRTTLISAAVTGKIDVRQEVM